MANSVMKDRSGPDWPLGFVGVVTPGTPVNAMNYVDPTQAMSPTANNSSSAEYSPRFHRITYQAYKPLGGANNASWTPNSGSCYIVRIGNNSAGGSGNRSDTGTIVAVIQPGEGGSIPPTAEVDHGSLSPYRYFVDADTAGDGLILLGVGVS